MIPRDGVRPVSQKLTHIGIVNSGMGWWTPLLVELAKFLKESGRTPVIDPSHRTI